MSGRPAGESGEKRSPRGGAPGGGVRWWHAFLAGLAHAGCMIAAFAPIGLWGFSLVAIAPLVWLADRAAGSGRNAFRVAAFAAIGTVPFHAFEHRWLWEVAGPGYPVLVVLLAGFPLVFVWMLARFRRRWSWVPMVVGAPVLWAGLEFFRGTIAFDGYPWYFVGHPLIDAPAWLLDAGTVVGAFGLSFLAAAVGGIVGWAAARPTLLRAGIGAGVIGAIVVVVGALGWPARARASLDDPIDTFIRVGIVQTNLPQSNKMDWEPADRIDDLLWFLEMTEEAARAGEPDLIVWPETMFPGSSLEESSRRAEEEARIAWFIDRPDGTREAVPIGALAETLFERQRAIGIPMVVGGLGYDNLRFTTDPDGSIQRAQDHLYNSVFAINDGAVLGRYDKVHLTPFGEVMPYISAWPWLEKRLLGFAASGMSFDLSASRVHRVLEVPVSLERPTRGDSDFRGTFHYYDRVLLATPVCFESTDAELCRRLVGAANANAPILIVNPTNDGWFGGVNAAREQHLQLSRWRALELGVSIVRAANTGISCAIDHRGRIIARGVRRPEDRPGQTGPSELADGVIVAELPLPVGRTIYARYGDWPASVLVVLAGGIVAAAWWPRKAPGGAPAENPPSMGR